MTGKNSVSRRPGGLLAPSAPQSQTCAKCGAVFRWEPSEPQTEGSPLVAHLVKPVDGCDCGYGTGAPVLSV